MKLSRIVILLVTLSAYSFADIAPISYDTFSIMPIEAKGISMDTAKVDITWGDPCEAVAVFKMSNATGQPQSIQVGFPLMIMSYYRADPSKYDYEMSFNGSEAVKLGITKHKSFSGSDEQIEWYGDFFEFPVGESEIIVTYKIPLTRSYLPYRNTVHYYLQTGSGWEGEIKKEIVTFHFPYGVDERQIESDTTPKRYTHTPKSISWVFNDFEPTYEDDILIELLDPRAFQTIEDLEFLCEKYPKDRLLKLSLVKHYFALGRYKGYGAGPPHLITKQDLNDVLDDVKDDEDRSFVERSFEEISDGRLECQTEGEDHWKLADILSEADYEPAHARSIYVDKARLLLEGHLEEYPNDEFAWLVYLHNYYRFKFRGSLSGKHEKVIDEALVNCANSIMLRRWKGLYSEDGNVSYDFPNLDSSPSFSDHLRLLGISSGVFTDID
ncbi:MAG: hypothetical protein ACSHX8_11320 [Opitutaceae bacterium]